ncbi:uncharacterized protein LOC132197695 [Neocloeon triangulifer]|uniref:uncharacterized protein LOC132197695 n=1 Tax=Neocloeon triangulifer TaxID=2078957 RepID=UPI00286F0DD8|nr:uncharacterized protein LOC132197695 [Neocloeon triangulifer]
MVSRRWQCCCALTTMRSVVAVLAVALVAAALASPPPLHLHHRKPKLQVRHVGPRNFFLHHPQYVPAASRHVFNRHHFPGFKGSSSCSDCSKQGSWKPIIPSVKVQKSIEYEPLVSHVESHPGNYHVQVESFPAESHSPPTNFGHSPPWGGDGGFGGGGGGSSYESNESGSSGSSESNESNEVGADFFKGGGARPPPVQRHKQPTKGSKEYAVHEQVDEPPAPRRTPKGGIQLPPMVVPPSTTPAPPSFAGSPNFFRRRRQPNVRIIPSRKNVRIVHLKKA